MSTEKFRVVNLSQATEAVGVLLQYRTTFCKDQENRLDCQKRGVLPDGVSTKEEAEAQLARHAELKPMIAGLYEHAQAIGRILDKGLDYRKSG